jgi:hypothetical protein
MGRGEVDAVVVNPVMPEIVYAGVKRYGIYRSVDGGRSWTMVGRDWMDRRQRRYNSIDLNPHNPAELWVAHFGTAFSKGIDFEARRLMEARFLTANFVANPGFEEKGSDGSPRAWHIEQPWPPPAGESPLFSVGDGVARDGKRAARFHFTQAYVDTPNLLPAEREQLRLEQEAGIPARAKRGGGSLGRRTSMAWMYQKIDPYFTSLMRGRRVVIEMDVLTAPGDSPVFVYVSEARDYNVHWIDAEASLEDAEPIEGQAPAAGQAQWRHCAAIGKVTEDALWLRVTVGGERGRPRPLEAYVDNIRLRLAE